MNRKARHFLRAYEAIMASAFVILALTLPKMSVVFLELIPGVQSAVICTGSEYVVLRTGDDGTPLEITEIEDNACLRAVENAPQDKIALFWQRLALSFQDQFVRKPHSESSRDALARLELSRAPPLVH